MFLFVVFALATQQKTGAVRVLVAVFAVAVSVRVVLAHAITAKTIAIGVGVAAGTMISGLGMGFLASRQAQQIDAAPVFGENFRLLHFDRGLTESVRKALGEIALAFGCEQACLAIRDEELERLFVWKIHPNEREPGGPETPAAGEMRNVFGGRVRSFVRVGIRGPGETAECAGIRMGSQDGTRGS